MKKFSDNADKKVIKLNDLVERYVNLTEKKVNEGDLISALSLSFSLLKIDYSADTLADIADIYADMGLYDLSNKYWFKYMSVAKKDKVSVAYEELAINAFEMKNYALSGYYFDKKIKTDGFLDRGDLDEEILNALSEDFDKRDLYKIVYPERLSDYSAEVNFAKNAFTAGDYEGVIRFLKDVPEESPSYGEAANLISLAYFASGQTERAVAINRFLLKKYGEDLSVLCNLSTMYKFLKDEDKSSYFYSKAKEMSTADKDLKIKLALCALEQNDHITGAKTLKEVIDDDFYDPKLLLFYGLALLNCGEYKEGREAIRKAYTIDPDDGVAAYYAKLSLNLAEEKPVKVKFPLPYSDDLPKEERDVRKKKIKEAAKSTRKGRLLKDDEIKEYMRWGLRDDEAEIFRNSVLFLTEAGAEEILADALIDEEVEPRIKQAIIFMHVAGGNKNRINVSSFGVYFTFKPKKLACEYDDQDKFFLSYATAVSKMAFSGENLDKIAASVNELYKKLKDSELINLISRDELAAVAVLRCGFSTVKDEKRAGELFDVDGDKVGTIMGYLDVRRLK